MLLFGSPPNGYSITVTGDRTDNDVGTVVGRRASLKRSNFLLLAAMIGVYVVLGILTGRYQLPILAGGLLVILAIVSRRPPTTVSAGGIRRPWQTRGVIGWGEVASVVSPAVGLPGVRLELTSGKVVALTDIPSEETEAVATIGDKPIRPVRLPRTSPPAAHSEPTPMDIEADVERRAQALADERRRLGMG